MESLVSLPAAHPLVPLPWHANPVRLPDDNSHVHLHQKSAFSPGARTQQPQPHSKLPPKAAEESSMKPSRENCDRRRPGEDASRLPNISQQSMSQSLTPFLREHIPTLYAPIGKPDLPSMANLKNKDPNSKYCYRHRPDSKCRRAADETKMGLIQRDLETLPAADRQAITNVWSLFSAAPTKHRELMLQGIITQCCFPQLSAVSREVHEQLKIDFMSALPTELSLKILCYLDCSSLCKAAQVNRRWNALSGDDLVWHRMCEQHIGRKCEKCQWGLPRLEKKRLREWKTQHQLALPPTPAIMAVDDTLPTSTATKRAAETSEDEGQPKRRCTEERVDCNPDTGLKRKFRPWKDVYRDRFKVGSNWQKGRCTIKTFSGHANGVTCLQFDDNMLATGSYDATIKIWNIEKGEVVRTLQGHTMGIRALQFDDRMLVSGSLDSTVKIWNWRTGVCINTLNHQGGVITVHMEGDYLASGSMDRSIKIFDFKTQQSFSLRGHTDWVNHVRLDMTSRTLLSASDDCTVKLWDLDSRTCIKTYEGHVGQVQQVLALPDDFEFEDESARDADASSAASNRSVTPVTSPSPHCSNHQAEERAAYGPIFLNDPERPLPPRYMLTGSLDLTLRLWDTATGKSPRCFWGHVEGVWGLAVDTLRYVSGANDATVKVWDPRTGKCERTFTGHSGPVTCVGLSDSRFASGGEDGDVRLYSFEGEPGECLERGTPS
ncbi:quinon protein alcohol dehydrogenase-like superfamily [Xylaria bambusicola]|uniref:quinon protein alcohol dehydrogenase-like superfamily n=1 Tax=Xylaria bambusicola TaxID=326684 RepID=UPI002007B3C3|nr:quinon protein alcohol dehydrogenase-like superfamily [Xylaria bambusicola]KAI0526399.1 quinon protein alcohol dehydrogenase-like superfamily [Xylaria bambusicola]